jgi:Glycerate kinase
MLRALIDTFNKERWDDIEALKDVAFTIASDVKNPLYGENGAAHIFAPQKGATPEMVLALDERAKKFAEISAKHFGYDRSQMPGAGAAGGLGYAFLQYLNAKKHAWYSTAARHHPFTKNWSRLTTSSSLAKAQPIVRR